MRAALPLLRDASRVDVVVIGSAADQTREPQSVDMLRRWLLRYVVGAEVSLLPRTDRSKADMLTQFAVDRGREALECAIVGCGPSQ